MDGQEAVAVAAAGLAAAGRATGVSLAVRSAHATSSPSGDRPEEVGLTWILVDRAVPAALPSDCRRPALRSEPPHPSRSAVKPRSTVLRRIRRERAARATFVLVRSA